jgi:hypothetical protein
MALVNILNAAAFIPFFHSDSVSVRGSLRLCAAPTPPALNLCAHRRTSSP